MTFSAAFPRTFSAPFKPDLAADVVASWWPVASKPCVAAYQPKGAASLAVSYTNLANPGTYDAAPGVASTWASGTGWGLNGSNQYLTTGISNLTRPITILICATTANLDNYRTWIGSSTPGGIHFYQTLSGANFGALELARAGMTFIAHSTGLAPHDGSPYVAGFSYDGSGNYSFYLDGAESGNGTNNVTLDAIALQIGCMNGQYFFNGTIRSLAIYSDILTAGEVATVSAAMAAL